MIVVRKNNLMLVVLLCFITCFVIVLLPQSDTSIFSLISRSEILERRADTKLNHIFKPTRVRELKQCVNRHRIQTIEEAGNYIIFYNLVAAERKFFCHESITFATQGEYSFLDNIVPLVQRWQGPISVTLYAPGDDFKPTLDSIAYVRSCYDDLIRDLVSFHVYYDRRHTPKLDPSIIQYIEAYNWTWDCSSEAPFETIRPKDRYRVQKKMEFPINVGRNIAIRESHTHFLLAADMELYPSLNVIPRFFDMLIRDHQLLNTFPKKVYVLPVFESSEEYPSPQSKTELQELFKMGKALFFGEKFCEACHNIPKREEWLKARDNGKLAIFSNTSRIGTFRRWEPVYIGTHEEPLFQERVTWDGGSDKMVKDFVLCLLEYQLLVLDNAFMVHKPGFKGEGTQKRANKKNMTKIILHEIVPELEVLYGKRKGCVIGGQFSHDLPNYQ